jgi:hypothetical protein
MTITPFSPRLTVAEIIEDLRRNAGADWLDAFKNDARRGWLFGPDLHPVRANDMLIIAEAMGGWPANPAAQPVFYEVAA